MNLSDIAEKFIELERADALQDLIQISLSVSTTLVELPYAARDLLCDRFLEAELADPIVDDLLDVLRPRLETLLVDRLQRRSAREALMVPAKLMVKPCQLVVEFLKLL